MFQAGRARTGVVTDLTIGASSASRLTVKWKTLVASGTGVLASPAVAFITQLHKPLVFAATTTGTVTARDLATTGAVIWTSAGNGPIVASPAVSGNTVYVGTESHYLFAFDAATGAVQCAFSLGGAVVSSPVVGQVDRTGPVVFFGDVGAGVANSPGHMWAINGVGNAGAPCTVRWVFARWNNAGPAAKRTGTCSPPALTTDSLGRPLLVFGSSDPDDSVDARTGLQTWRSAPASGDYFSSPSVSGSSGDQVFLIGDDAGVEHAYRVRNGSQVLELNSAGAIYSSDAPAFASVVFGTTDGYLYALA